jgi:hypothetical protein
VSPREYLDRHYPTYCPGWSVLYSRDVAHQLYEATQRENYFWIDDVLVTGIVARKVRARHLAMSPWRWSSGDAYRVLMNGTAPGPDKHGRLVFGPYELEATEISALWELRQTN